MPTIVEQAEVPHVDGKGDREANTSQYVNNEMTMKESVLIGNEVASSTKNSGTHKEAMNTKQAKQCQQDCEDEIASIKRLNMYKLVNKPVDRKQLYTKWVLKEKEDEKGVVVKFKAKWVVKGYM